MLKVLVGFIARKWGWAKQKPLFWVNLGLVVITCLLIFIFPGPITDAGPSDLRLRLWSMALQLLGAVTVWLDLTGTARVFGRGGFLKSTLEWLKAFFVGERKLVAANLFVNYPILGQPRLSQRRPASMDAPIEVRIEALEYNLTQMDSDLSGAFHEIGEQASKVQKQLMEESTKRESAHKELESAMQEAIVGNYTTLAFGAAWVFVGIVLSALSPEITRIVAGQWATVWATL